MKDPFAKERAVFQAKKKPEKQPEPVDDFTLRFFKPLLASLKGDLEPLIKANKGEKGDTPIKGKDYFTKEEITAIKDEVLSRIPTPENGKDAEVNYDLILAYVTEQVSKIPKAKDGDDGKDAVIDYAKVVADVLKEIPKTEKLTVDYTKIQELIDEKVKTIPWNEKRVVGYSSLKQLTDVILDGVPQDDKGNYILTPGGGPGGGHTIEDEGTPLTQRDTLNFVGAGVTVTDAGGKTVVTIPGGGGGSGITRSVATISTPTTAGSTAATDYVYFVDNTTLTLPTAVSNTNRYTVKCISGTCVVDGDGSETIDGSANIGIQVEDSVDLISNNTEFKVI